MSSVSAQSDLIDCSNYLEYSAEKGETLGSVAEHFGNSEFAALIQSSNPLAFNNSNQIISEVALKIPHKIYHYKDSEWSIQEVFENPFCNDLNATKQKDTTLNEFSENQTPDTTEKDELQKFRDAFETLIEEQRTSEQEEAQAKAEQEIFIELDGLVMDETRSKIGRDFYDIFYQQWKAPPNSSNYTITISEKPTPSLGSFISVIVNDQQVFQYRLQPRYEIIEQVANYAVRITYVYMKDNKHEYIIY